MARPRLFPSGEGALRRVRVPQLVGDLPDFLPGKEEDKDDTLTGTVTPPHSLEDSAAVAASSSCSSYWHGRRGVHGTLGRWITLAAAVSHANNDTWFDTQYTDGGTEGSAGTSICWDRATLFPVNDPCPPPDRDRIIWMYENGDLYFGPWITNERGEALEHGPMAFLWNHAPAGMRGLIHAGGWEDGYLHGPGMSRWSTLCANWLTKPPPRACPRINNQLFIYRGFYEKDYKSDQRGTAICTLRNGETRQGQWQYSRPVGWNKHRRLPTPSYLRHLVPLKDPKTTKPAPKKRKAATAAASANALSRSRPLPTRVQPPRTPSPQRKSASSLSSRGTSTTMPTMGAASTPSLTHDETDDSSVFDEEKEQDKEEDSSSSCSSDEEETVAKKNPRRRSLFRTGRREVGQVTRATAEDDSHGDDDEPRAPKRKKRTSGTSKNSTSATQDIEGWLLDMFLVGNHARGRQKMQEYAQALEKTFFTLALLKKAIANGTLTEELVPFEDPVHRKFFLLEAKDKLSMPS